MSIQRIAHMRLFLTAALPLVVAAACQPDMDEREKKFNELDSLRVLAIGTEPADAVPGETAELSALIYDPLDRVPEYRWSWCPVRSGASDGFACALSEEVFLSAWARSGAEIPPPPYDLGRGETARFEHVFDSDRVSAFCSEIYSLDPPNLQASLACLEGLDFSVRLEIANEEESVVAIRTLTLLESEEEDRNANPGFNGELEIRPALEESNGSDDPLSPDLVYMLRVGIDEEEAEVFLPEAEAGLDDPVERRETMVLTWFVTAGFTIDVDWLESEEEDDEEDEFGQSIRTSFVDGSSPFLVLLENLWKTPPADERVGEARLYLVLRDERGGVAWSQHEFQIGSGQ